MVRYRFEGLWQAGEWLANVVVQTDQNGTIISLAPNGEASDAEDVAGFALPGFRNAHSHAFQYAMAGLAEHLQRPGDDFWSWREAMYRLALSVSPEQVETIASMLYAQMLRHGYTAVAEFHYLHHDLDGSPYASLAEMGERLMRAAQRTGIRLTLLPMYYHNGDFDQPAHEGQRRFLSKDVAAYADLLAATGQVAEAYPNVRVGAGIHSLRAAGVADIQDIFEMTTPGTPLHLHIAEQQKEVEACRAIRGTTPVAWLLDHAPVGPDTHLVHATHLDAGEVQRLARSGATAVICPTTEGNLGDGFFALRDYLALGGSLAIGSDSHVGLSPIEELRWLDYGQRLRDQRRNVICRETGEDSGERLYEVALSGGGRALGEQKAPALEVGQALDAVVLDASHPLQANTSPRRRLSSAIYGGDSDMLLGTLVAGRWRARDGRHLEYAEISRAFRAATAELGRK